MSNLGLPEAPSSSVLVVSTRVECLGAGLAGPFSSIQAAIDTAPGGAVVVVDAGIWSESLTITKDLTLLGVLNPTETTGNGGAIGSRAVLRPPSGQHGVVIGGGASVVLSRFEISQATGVGIRIVNAKAVLADVWVRETAAYSDGTGGNGVQAIGQPSSPAHILAVGSQVVKSESVGILVDRGSLQLADSTIDQNAGGGIAIVRGVAPTEAKFIVDPYTIEYLVTANALGPYGASVFEGPASIVDPYITSDPNAIVDPYIVPTTSNGIVDPYIMVNPCNSPPPVDPDAIQASIIVRTRIRYNRSVGLGLWGSTAFIDESDISGTQPEAAVIEAPGGGRTVVEAYGDGALVRSYDGRAAGLVAGTQTVLEGNGRAGILVESDTKEQSAVATMRGIARYVPMDSETTARNNREHWRFI